MLIVTQLVGGKYCFLSGTLAPQVKQRAKGKFQTEQRIDS